MTKFDRIVRDICQAKYVAYEELNRVADETWLPRLYRLLKRKGVDWLREAASQPIIRMDGLRALPQLLHALDLGRQEGHDNDSLVSNIVCLVSMNAREAAPILLEMINAKRARERQDAAWLLGHIPEEVTPELLMAALADPDPGVRGAAVGSLASLEGRPEVLAALIAALKDPDAKVRVDAASSLGWYGDQQAMPALRAVLKDPDEQVRYFARDALWRLK